MAVLLAFKIVNLCEYYKLLQPLYNNPDNLNPVTIGIFKIDYNTYTR